MRSERIVETSAPQTFWGKVTIIIPVGLENINLILAFIIYIISQPIELLNIYSAFIVYQYGNARGTFCYNR